jgi:hypothetical protein
VDNHLVGCVSDSASMAEDGRTRGFGEQGCSTLALSIGGFGQEAGRGGVDGGLWWSSPHIHFRWVGRMGKHRTKAWPGTPCRCRQRRHLKVSFTLLDALRLMFLAHPRRVFLEASDQVGAVVGYGGVH